MGGTEVGLHPRRLVARLQLLGPKTPGRLQSKGHRSVHKQIRFWLFLVLISVAAAPLLAATQSNWPEPVVLTAGWQLQDVAKVPQAGAEVASARFKAKEWYAATVPGTVLTTLVNDRVYPEPLYGENNRPETIPESLCHTSYWYRTEVKIPKQFAGRHIWLNFDGINYSSAIWVNGTQVGTTRGRVHSRQIRYLGECDGGEEGGDRGAGGAAAASRRAARAHAARGDGAERWHHGDRRADVSLDYRMGLASGDSRSRHGHLAEGISLGDGPVLVK